MNKIIIILSIIASAVLWLKYIYKYDKIEPEPIGAVLKVTLLGGIISTTIAGLANYGFSRLTNIPIHASDLSYDVGFIFSMFVGFNEEIVKATVAVFLLRNLKDLNEPLDAIIYSTAIGLGFSFIENFSYSLKYGFVNLVLRSFTAMPLHIGLAALWGYPIAEVKFIKNKSYFDAMKYPVALAALIHAIYDFFQFSITIPVLPLVLAIGIAYLIIRQIRKKAEYLQTQSPFLKPGHCPKCGTENFYKATHCQNCGTYIRQDFYIICDSCYSKNPIQNSICSHCGEGLR